MSGDWKSFLNRDFFNEFFHECRKLPDDLRMVVLGNKPPFDIRAFQELNPSILSLVEGTVLNRNDLERCRADLASSCVVLADR